MKPILTDWTDAQVRSGIKREVIDEREGLARFLMFLAEVERRELFLEDGCSTIRVFCERALGLSKSTAKKRVWVSRAATKFPVILELLAEGKFHLTAFSMLIKHLTQENHQSLLREAEGKSEVELKWWLSELFPKPAPDESEPDGQETIVPLDGKRAKFELIVDKELVDLLERSREVHRHKFRDGNALAILKRALREDLNRHDPVKRREKREKIKAKRVDAEPAIEPLPPSFDNRVVPRGTADDAGKLSDDHCAYVSPHGVLCTERGGLENDHQISWAMGGSSKDKRNIQKLCFAHNRWKGRLDFGKDFRKNAMARPPECRPS